MSSSTPRPRAIRRKALRGGSAALFLALLSAAPGCNEAEPPVASLAVEPASVELSFAEIVDLRFEWTPLVPLDETESPRVFVHLLDSEGELVRTFDHDFPSSWTVGEPASYSVSLYQSAMGPALPAGPYDVRVGLYGSEGRRWPLDAPGAESNEAYRVVVVDASDSAEGLPAFSFDSKWLPEEIGRDRQVLVRRWAGDAGKIRVSGVSQPGTLWLRLAMPSGDLADHDLALADGAEEPSVTLSATCSDAVEHFGPGQFREVRLAIPEDCEIELTPNHQWVAVDTGVGRSIALEGIAWAR